MKPVEFMSDRTRDLARYDRDVAAARIGANATSMIYHVAAVTSLANRIEADAQITNISTWERKELESQAAKFEEAAALLRNAAQHGLVRQLEAAE